MFNGALYYFAMCWRLDKRFPCKICPEKYYVRCHKIYSRCLRFSYETFGIAHTSDINCPYTKFKKYRVK